MKSGAKKSGSDVAKEIKRLGKRLDLVEKLLASIQQQQCLIMQKLLIVGDSKPHSSDSCVHVQKTEKMAESVGSRQSLPPPRAAAASSSSESSSSVNQASADTKDSAEATAVIEASTVAANITPRTRLEMIADAILGVGDGRAGVYGAEGSAATDDASEQQQQQRQQQQPSTRWMIF